jgi:addiction module HigA family antidote
MGMKNPVHPGIIVNHDCLEPLGLSVTDTAKALGVNRTTLSKLESKRAGISPNMAIRLEKAGFSSADLWLRLQAAYDLAQARQHEDEITVLRIEREPVGIQ